MKARNVILALFFVLLMSSNAAAAIYTELTIPNVAIPTQTYVTVEGDIVKDTSGAITGYKFNVSVAPGLTMDKFYFNCTETLTAQNFVFSGGSAGITIGSNVQADGFGRYYVELSNPGQGVTSLSFTINLAGLTDEDFLVSLNDLGSFFAAHVKGFNYDGITSAYVRDGAPVVPEPTTLLLLGSGLVGLAAYRKNRRR